MFDIHAFQEAIRMGNYFWKKHVLQRMVERGIKQSAVTETLLYGEIIKEYIDDRPFASALFLYFIDGQPLHAVASFDETEKIVYIITVYIPSPDFFEEDFKSKKK